MAQSPQRKIKRFADDLAKLGIAMAKPDNRSVHAALSTLPRRESESETDFAVRSAKVMNAYLYLLKNLGAFQAVELVTVSELNGLSMQGRLLHTLYLFFCAGDDYLSERPELESVVDAALQMEGDEPRD
ncbi:MAG: hypothetical protein V4671_34100 [Armatimonadota bacterium]